VRLRPDQYENLKKWKCSCDVFVNYLGDICIRQFERDPPDHGRGVIIGTTDWFESYDRDKEGYPVFQGTRGVCVKINSSPPPITSPSLLSDMLGKTTRSLKKLFIDGTDQPLLKVMSRRLELFDQIARIDTPLKSSKKHVFPRKQLRKFFQKFHQKSPSEANSLKSQRTELEKQCAKLTRLLEVL
jgi:hypothetical protein